MTSMERTNFSDQPSSTILLSSIPNTTSKLNANRIEGKCLSCLIALFEGIDNLPWKTDEFRKWFQWENLVDQHASLQSTSFLLQSLFSIEVNKTKFENTIRNLRDESTASNNNNWATFVYQTNTQFSNWLKTDEPTDLFLKQLSVRLALMGHSLSNQTIDWWWKHVVWMCESPGVVLSWMKRQVALFGLAPTYSSDPTFGAWKMLFSEYNSKMSFGTHNIVVWSLLFKVAYLHNKVDEKLCKNHVSLKECKEHNSFTIIDILQPLVSLVYFITRLFSLEEVKLSRQIDNGKLYNMCVACITKLVQNLLHNDSELADLLRYQSTNSNTPLRDFLKSWIIEDVLPIVVLLSDYLNPISNIDEPQDIEETRCADNGEQPLRFNFPVEKEFNSVPGLTVQEFTWMVETDSLSQRKMFHALLLGTPPPSSPDWIQFGDNDLWKRTFAEYSLRQREKMQLPVEYNNQLIPSKDSAGFYREYSYVRRYFSKPTERKIWESQVLSELNGKECKCFHCNKAASNYTYCAICGKTFCEECLTSQQGFHRLRPFYIKEFRGNSCYVDPTRRDAIQDITLFFCGICPPFWAVIQDPSQRKRLRAIDGRPRVLHQSHQQPKSIASRQTLHQSLSIRPSRTVILTDLESTNLANVNM